MWMCRDRRRTALRSSPTREAISRSAISPDCRLRPEATWSPRNSRWVFRPPPGSKFNDGEPRRHLHSCPATPFLPLRGRKGAFRPRSFLIGYFGSAWRQNLFRERLTDVRFRAPEFDALGSVHRAFADNLRDQEVGDQFDLARLQ